MALDMPVFRHDRDQMEPAYGSLCRRVYHRDGYPTPFGAHTCLVPPGGSSAPHAHLEGTTFFIARGQGRIRIGTEPETALNAGDVVFIPPHTQHVLTNTSDTEELWFTSVRWDPRGADRPDLPEKSLLAAAPPTPNGNLHLGHLSGPYLALDALARIRRQQGVAVTTHCGTDDNQTYVTMSAAHRKEDPLVTADHFSEAIQETLTKMHMLPDVWLRPLHNQEYRGRVLSDLETLLARGHVVKKAIPTLWCTACDRALVEAFVSGGCPHCKQGAGGGGCEACFVGNLASDLIDPVCTACQTPAEVRQVDRMVFPMTPWLPRLRDWVSGLSMPSWLDDLSRKLWEEPFATPEIPISHPGSWGIEAHGQRLFGWFEMAMGFHMQDCSGEVIHCFGSDNAWYYLTLLPAMALALEVPLPRQLLTNRCLQLDGSKFSTSRRHAIWGDEARQFLSADSIRLSLAADRPETEETNFTLERLAERTDLRWDRWFELVLSWGKSVCAAGTTWTATERAFHRELQRLWLEAEEHRDPATFSLRRQVQVLEELALRGQRFAEQHRDSGSDTAQALAVTSLGVFARLAEPIMPELGAALSECTGMALVADTTCSLATPGTPLKPLEVTLASRAQVAALKASRLACATR